MINLAASSQRHQKLNHQFMLGARNQAILTEYVSGMETVKSLQMEPQVKNNFSPRRADSFTVRRMKNKHI